MKGACSKVQIPNQEPPHEPFRHPLRLLWRRQIHFALSLGCKGFATIEEPGRRIVAEEQAGDGKALPWIDLAAFAHRAIAMALEDRERAASLPGWVFFDRSLIDAAAALKAATGDERQLNALKQQHRYHARVFSPRHGRKFTSKMRSVSMIWPRQRKNISACSKSIRRWDMR